jgi:glycosyltransferase involved in cell wall biosynthesis
MQAEVPVSAVLITRDAEAYLERVLEPLRVCSEVLILDSGSSDRTQRIAEDFGTRWHCHPFDGYGPQKRRAVALAEHDWVLSVDADEVIDDRAAAAIAAIDWPRQDPHSCWRIRRRPFIAEREIRHGHWVPERVVRLFHRAHHDFSDVIVHETVTATGPLHTLPGSMLHFSYRDLADVFRSDYYRLKAVRYRDQGRRAGGAVLAARAMAAFLNSYALRRGFLEGPAGVVVALAAAVNAATGLALASEQESGSRKDRLDEIRLRS